MRIAVLGSGTGSNFSALTQGCQSGEISGEIILVGSDQPKSGILEKAQALQIPTFIEKNGPDFSPRLTKHLLDAEVDLVCLAGFMRIIKEPLLETFPDRIINIHPSLLPKYPGIEAWNQALEDGALETGCTVHFVDAGIDTGRIILQKSVAILPSDTPRSLHARIQEAEHRTYVEAVQKVISAGLPSDHRPS